MAKKNAQQILFDKIKDVMPVHLSYIDEISNILKVSNDSVYRRLRGETLLTLDETILLCKKYSLSVDDILGSSSNSITCEYLSPKSSNISFNDYALNIIEKLKLFKQLTEIQLIYSAKDLPVFYYFHSANLGAFKSFFWMKTLQQSDSLKNKKFKASKAPKAVEQLGNAVVKFYSEISSVEIWNDETINSTLRQIEYYYDAGLFDSNTEGLMVCDEFEKIIQHIKSQAEVGKKIYYNAKCEMIITDVDYHLYYNEILLLDNNISVKMGENISTYMTYTGLNMLYTNNVIFGEEVESWLINQMNKSNLISKIGEKERNKFFNKIFNKIAATRQYIQ